MRIKKIIAKIFTADRPLASLPILSAPSKFNSVTATIIEPPTQAIDTFGYHSRINNDIAVASLDIDRMVPVQYSHPTTNPVPCPSSRAAKVLKDPTVGFPTVISDKAKRIRYTSPPAKIYDSNIEGPAAFIATDDPRKKEPPITLPNAIIVSCHADNPFRLPFIAFSPILHFHPFS